MKTQYLKITILFLAATLISCGSQNSPVAPQTQSAIKPTQEATVPVPENLVQVLNLTEEQQDHLTSLKEAFSPDIQAAQNNTSDPSEYEDLMDEFENAFYNLLTEDQQAEYQTYKSELLPVLEDLAKEDA